MRTRKLLYMGCLMAASLVTFSSCGDFLDEDPKGQLNPDTFYTIEDDYTAGVNTLYLPPILSSNGNDAYLFSSASLRSLPELLLVTT